LLELGIGAVEPRTAAEVITLNAPIDQNETNWHCL
jgi:hypothetical protein